VSVWSILSCSSFWTPSFLEKPPPLGVWIKGHKSPRPILVPRGDHEVTQSSNWGVNPADQAVGGANVTHG